MKPSAKIAILMPNQHYQEGHTCECTQSESYINSIIFCSSTGMLNWSILQTLTSHPSNLGNVILFMKTQPSSSNLMLVIIYGKRAL